MIGKNELGHGNYPSSWLAAAPRTLRPHLGPLTYLTDSPGELSRSFKLFPDLIIPILLQQLLNFLTILSATAGGHGGDSGL
jgi:hypothetical protein